MARSLDLSHMTINAGCLAVLRLLEGKPGSPGLTKCLTSVADGLCMLRQAVQRRRDSPRE